MKREISPRGWRIAAAGTLLLAVLLALAIGGQRLASEDPAPPSVLSRIGQKNEDAAIEAAARMKADSEASAAAADARAAAIQEPAVNQAE